MAVTIYRLCVDGDMANVLLHCASVPAKWHVNECDRRQRDRQTDRPRCGGMCSCRRNRLH